MKVKDFFCQSDFEDLEQEVSASFQTLEAS